MLRNASLKNKEERYKRRELRLHAMSSYPEISQVGTASKQQFTQTQYRNNKTHVNELIAFLNDRFIALYTILAETEGEPVKTLEQIRRYLHADTEAYLSCSYLFVQIVSVMNQLHRYGTLNKVDSRLPARMEYLVALRNALAHGDPVLESKTTTFIHMQSDVIDVTASIVYEFMNQFFAQIVNLLIPAASISSPAANPLISLASSASSSTSSSLSSQTR